MFDPSYNKFWLFLRIRNFFLSKLREIFLINLNISICFNKLFFFRHFIKWFRTFPSAFIFKYLFLLLLFNFCLEHLLFDFYNLTILKQNFSFNLHVFFKFTSWDIFVIPPLIIFKWFKSRSFFWIKTKKWIY